MDNKVKIVDEQTGRIMDGDGTQMAYIKQLKQRKM